MRRENFLILIGVLIVLAPFAGLPLLWLSWILPILGALVIIIGILFGRSRRATPSSAAVSTSS